jgi:hypothetical protein
MKAGLVGWLCSAGLHFSLVCLYVVMLSILVGCVFYPAWLCWLLWRNMLDILSDFSGYAGSLCCLSCSTILVTVLSKPFLYDGYAA